MAMSKNWVSRFWIKVALLTWFTYRRAVAHLGAYVENAWFSSSFNKAHIPAHIQNTQNLPKYFVYRGTPAHILAHSIKTVILMYTYILRTPWCIPKIENQGAGGDKISRAGGEGPGDRNKIIQKMNKYKKNCTFPSLFIEGTLAHILAHTRSWAYIYIYTAHTLAHIKSRENQTFQNVQKVNGKI